MALTVNTNISALNAYRNLTSTQGDMSKSLQRLSSGLRINSAADDAAGLAISEGIRAQVGGLKVASRNAQDGISVVQTAEGALNQVHSILQRMRDLAVQAGNDSNSDKARDAIELEANQLREELGRIANSTEFNGKKLLDGSETNLKFQVGSQGDANSVITVDLTDASVSSVQAALAIGPASGAQTATGTVATFGDIDGTWTFGQGSTSVDVDMSTGSFATNQDVVDHLNDSTSFSNNFVAAVDTDGAIKVTSKTSDTNAVTVTTTTPADLGGFSLTAGTPVTQGFDDNDSAQAMIRALDTQIQKVSDARATLGAIQNRFDYAIDNISVATENLSASESRIRDTDMALEMSNYTRAQILQQAGTAMLAQANQAPQAVLQLLQG